MEAAIYACNIDKIRKLYKNGNDINQHVSYI